MGAGVLQISVRIAAGQYAFRVLYHAASRTQEAITEVSMKYRILGIIAGLITIVAAFMPGGIRSFLLRKMKTAMYLIFG